MKLFRDMRKDGTIISTVKPTFMAWYGKYETAKVNGTPPNERIFILEGYETIEEAEKGHQKYLNMSQEEFDKLTPIG